MAADPRGSDRPDPCIVVVGNGSRDLTTDDPRGWRLGGGVTYGALALARLGIRTAALIGLDQEAMDASELDLLRAAGVDLVTVLLPRIPAVVTVDAPGGRIQTAVQVSDQLPVSALPAAWRAAPGWLFAPVAGELPDDWADAPGPDALACLGWQGLLRTLQVGEPTRGRQPWRSALVARSDLIGVSVHDLPDDWPLTSLDDLVRPEAEVLLTNGHHGGTLVRLASQRRQFIRYPAIPARNRVDPTGAGDTVLATLFGARFAAGGGAADEATGWIASRRRHLLLAAAAGSLLVEREGVDAVPTLAAIRDLLASRNPGAQPA